MPIRDIDGKVLKLRGPNPIMKEQEIWDKSKISLINMHWESVVVEDNKKTVSTKVQEFYEQPEKQIIPEEPVQNVVVIPTPKKIEEPKIEPPKEIPIPKVDSKVADIIEQRKRLYHCLPAVTVKDDFYGTSRKVYQQKFTFEGIALEEDNFKMTFWCEKQLEAGSVVYPVALTKRWWKVIANADKSGGYIMECITSDINPDFSD